MLALVDRARAAPLEGATEALGALNHAIQHDEGTVRTMQQLLAEEAEADREVVIRSIGRADLTIADLRDAVATLWRGEEIVAGELHTHAVLKALGLSIGECRAVWLHFRLGSSKPRSPREVAADLKIREADLSSLIGAIKRKVPTVSFPTQ